MHDLLYYCDVFLLFATSFLFDVCTTIYEFCCCCDLDVQLHCAPQGDGAGNNPCCKAIIRAEGCGGSNLQQALEQYIKVKGKGNIV